MKRFAFLDLLRALAVLLVAYGHLVIVATHAKSIPGVVPMSSVELPLLDKSQHILWKFEVFLHQAFQTQSAILGVLLFFVITGYLMPLMMERYTRIEFLMNRVLRIFPPLVVGVSLCFCVSAYMGIDVQLNSLLASITLTYKLLALPPITAILWTLFVEVSFYLFMFCIGKMTIVKLFASQLFMLGAVFSIGHFQGHYPHTAAHTIAFMSAILVGSALYLAEKEEDKFTAILLPLLSMCIAHFALKEFKSDFVMNATYDQFSSLLIPVMLFLVARIAFERFRLGETKFLAYSGLGYVAINCYPFYLIHVHVGLATMYKLKPYIGNQYLLFLVGFINALVISELVRLVIEKRSIRWSRNVRNYHIFNVAKA